MADSEESVGTARKPGRPRTGTTVQKAMFSIYPHQKQIVGELAERHHGGNVSRLIRHLIQDAWEREQSEQQQRRAA